MKTNFQIVIEIKNKVKPARHGYISAEEADKIAEIAQLDKMDRLALLNLRDTVVLYYETLKVDPASPEFDREKDMNNRDLCSAICAVIDSDLCSAVRAATGNAL